MTGKMTLILLLAISACAPAHYFKGGFVHDPPLDKFGASLSREGKAVIVRSYIRSEVPLRTEYIYENLDVTLPENVEVNKKYAAGPGGLSLWYAKGGQGGQIETRKARGAIVVRSLSGEKAVIECDLEFHGFTVKGHYMDPPAKIRRSGLLTAKKGYSLYP